MVDVHGSCDPRFEKLRSAFARSFERTDKPEVGAAVAVWQGGRLVADLWGGFADAAQAKPWARDTIANVYSTTKGVTALCALRLAERGALVLDAPVARYWPEFAASGKGAIPVRWLLSHQAGLPAVRAPLPDEALYDWRATCDALAAHAPWWEPGAKHGYHAMTFGHLVGEVVRRIDGRTLGAYFREDSRSRSASSSTSACPMPHSRAVRRWCRRPSRPARRTRSRRWRRRAAGSR